MTLNSISVVIPTLNEADTIVDALECVRKQSNVLETICVDAGSTDGTQGLIREKQIRLFESKKGRGHQISVGVQQSKGHVIFVMHADCRVAPDAFDRILGFLNQHPDHVGGCLGMRYQNTAFHKKILAFLNNARARFTGIAFGDQGQFFRKDILPLINGFPDQMLMEDIELSLRLKKKGKVCFLPKGIIVTKSRWDQKGFWKKIRRDILLIMEYLIKRRQGRGDPTAKDFYDRYYQNP